MKFLLPHRFKKIGLIAFPVGFSLWFIGQMGLIKNFLDKFISNEDTSLILTIIILVISFFSFLLGLYALAFSKEKIEDEMIQKIRLESFQMAALTQLLFLIFSFLIIAIYKEPNEIGWMLFLISIIAVFWLSYIFIFNYKVFKLK